MIYYSDRILWLYMAMIVVGVTRFNQQMGIWPTFRAEAGDMIGRQLQLRHEMGCAPQAMILEFRRKS